MKKPARLLLFLLALFFAAPSYADDCTAVPSGATVSVTGPGASGCKMVYNPNPYELCATTYSAAEWTSFVNSPPPGVTLGSCGCSTPCGLTPNGGTCTVYSSSTPASSCVSASATISCTNGVASGGNGWTVTSCTNGCTGTPWGSVSTGYSNTAYASAQPSTSCASNAQTRTCTNGTMSGSYTATSCAEPCATSGACSGGPDGSHCRTFQVSSVCGQSCCANAQCDAFCSNGTWSGDICTFSGCTAHGTCNCNF